jgi:hypothetical protein
MEQYFQDPDDPLNVFKGLHFIIALVITMAKQGVYVQAYSE